jgi:hypothetical protein
VQIFNRKIKVIKNQEAGDTSTSFHKKQGAKVVVQIKCCREIKY